MASLSGRAALASSLLFVTAPSLRADVGPPPWSGAVRTFALAPGAVDPELGDARAGRAFDATLWSRAGFGLDVDGEFLRSDEGALARSSLLFDAGIGFRALDARAIRIDLLTGARVDASRSWAAAASPASLSAGAVPMAGARVTLGLAESVHVALRAGVAPDDESDAAWRISGTLRLGLGSGLDLVLDARWASGEASVAPGSGPEGDLGRASFWAGFALPF